MLPLALSATRRSTTTDSAISCMTSCTGWTFLSRCSTSCVQRSIHVCSTEHHSTWRTDASTPQTLLVGSICVRRLPFRTATPTFNVRSFGLFCGRQGDLVLVTTDYARSVTPGSENFSFLVLLALDALRFMRYINLLLTLTNIAVPVCYGHRKTDWWSFYDRPRSPSTYRGATQNNDFVAATVADSVNVTVIGRA